MAPAVKPPTGRHIWQAVRDELRLNLYPLPFSTLAPTVYHVYLHPHDFEAVESIAPRIVSQVQQALTDEVEAVNRGLRRAGRRVLARLLVRDDLPPIEVPGTGWEVYLQPDRDGELKRGQLGIVSSLALPSPPEYGGTPTTRIVKSVVGHGHRTATASDVPLQAPATAPAPASGVVDAAERARLSYEDEQGSHLFVMKKDVLSIGRGGSAAWVDVRVDAATRVSREHCRLRRDPSGRFYIQDVSLWGTSVNGQPLPPALKNEQGVAHPGDERPLPPKARIGLADAVVIEFEAVTPS